MSHLPLSQARPIMVLATPPVRGVLEQPEPIPRFNGGGAIKAGMTIYEVVAKNPLLVGSVAFSQDFELRSMTISHIKYDEENLKHIAFFEDSSIELYGYNRHLFVDRDSAMEWVRYLRRVESEKCEELILKLQEFKSRLDKGAKPEA